MSKELRELLNTINQKKKEAKDLVVQNKITEARKLTDEIKELSNKAELLAELDEDEEEDINEKIDNKKAKEIKSSKKMDIVNAFVNCFKAMAKREKAPEDAVEVLNAVTSMTEEVPADGGLTVPQDIQTSIKELRRGQDALEEIVNVEPVSTLSGSRVIEKDAESNPWDNVDEEADFPDVQGPQFENISYKAKKKGGILKLTKELLSDTSENIMRYLRKWIAKKSKVTRNFLILKAIADNFGVAKAVATIDDLKNTFNVDIDAGLAPGSRVVTNQDGFNFLDKLKDTDGKYILQNNPVDATQRLLFGRYPIMVLSNKTLKTVTIGVGEAAVSKAPIYCGNFVEAITLFDREYMTIETSDQAEGLWRKDQVGVKVRERLDVKVVDSEAIVKGEITLP